MTQCYSKIVTDLYASRLRQCISSRALVEGKRVHAHILQSGFHGDTYVGNLLVDMYGKCGSVEDAMAAFRQIPQTNVFSWNIAMAACIGNGLLQEARSLFTKMPKRDVVSWTTILAAHAQNGHLEESKEIFARMPCMDVVVGNAMVAAYAQNGCMLDAASLFGLMVQRDAASWNSMLTAFAEAGQLCSCLEVFDLMPAHNVVSGTSIICAFSQHGCVDKATKMFEEIPQRDIASWNAMLQCYAGNGFLDYATDFLHMMPYWNALSWNALIHAYAENGKLQHARRLFQEMPSKDIFSWSSLISAQEINGLYLATCAFELMPLRSVVTVNALIGVYAHCGHVQKSKELYDQMPNRDEGSWNAMVQAFAKSDMLEQASMLLEDHPNPGPVLFHVLMDAYASSGELLQTKNIFDSIPHRDVVSWATMVTAYGENSSLELAVVTFNRMPQSNVPSWNAMVRAYAVNGHLGKAKSLFDCMPEHSVVSWTSLVSAYAQVPGYERQSLETFWLMNHLGVKPVDATLVSALDACATLACIVEGSKIHASLDSDSPRTQVIVATALINMYGKCGCLVKARRLFDEITCARDVVAWNAMIAAYAQGGDHKAALHLLTLMQIEGVVPEPYTFLSVIQACSHTGLVAAGWCSLAEMVVDHGIQPTLDHYAVVVDLLGRCGELAGAEELLHSMPFDPDAIPWTMLLGACREQGAEERGARAAAEVAKIAPESVAPYLLLPALRILTHVNMTNSISSSSYCNSL